jgi:hypothetical protein
MRESNLGLNGNELNSPNFITIFILCVFSTNQKLVVVVTATPMVPERLKFLKRKVIGPCVDWRKNLWETKLSTLHPPL